ncbi:MAG: universal stress protein [Rhodovibrionaceae bacterium]
MSYKSTMVAIPARAADATASQAACQFAIDHAKRSGGYVRGLLVSEVKDSSKPAPNPISSNMMPQEALGASTPARMPGSNSPPDPAEQIQARAREAFRTRCNAAGVEFAEAADGDKLPAASWQAERGSLDEVVDREAIGHDLVVLPVPSTVKDAGKAAKRTLTKTWKPVLIMPPSHKRASNGALGRMIIAWDGGLQAWHAVSAALPFLEQAESVEILTVDAPAGSEAMRAKLLHYLACHGIEATYNDRLSRSLSVGETILGEASDGEFSLLIMGAYTRGPLREKLKGGATQHVLNHAAATPVFLAH